MGYLLEKQNKIEKMENNIEIIRKKLEIVDKAYDVLVENSPMPMISYSQTLKDKWVQQGEIYNSSIMKKSDLLNKKTELLEILNYLLSQNYSVEIESKLKKCYMLNYIFECKLLDETYNNLLSELKYICARYDYCSDVTKYMLHDYIVELENEQKKI